jgi:alpha-methylacyl-CoA racemase
VIDAAMVDGAAALHAQAYGWRKMGFWTDHRGENLLDGGAYFYRCYRTADDRFIAVGAIESQFHAQFIAGLGLALADFDDHMNRSLWPARSARIADVVAGKTRREWESIFAPRDACVSPVLAPAEVEAYPANAARRMLVDGVPAPAPRFDALPH